MSAPQDTITVPAPSDDLSPVDLVVVRNRALADINDPLHAPFLMEVMTGVSLELLEYFQQNETIDLVRVKNSALQMAGYGQKLAIWCDRQLWNNTHSPNGTD